MNLFVGKRAAELNRKVNMQQMWPPVYVPFKYRLYPFRNQERKLMRQPDELRSLWNYALEQRQHEWKTGRVSVVYAEKCKSLAMWHSNDGSGIGQVYSHVAQEYACTGWTGHSNHSSDTLQDIRVSRMKCCRLPIPTHTTAPP